MTRVQAPCFLAPLLRPHAGSWSLINQRGELLASRLSMAFDSATRNKGLLGRERFDEGEAIVIAPCQAVHTFFMRFPIDVAHVARDGRVVKVTTNLRPWRIDAAWRAFAVVEFPCGTASRTGLAPGDSLAVAPSTP